MTDKQYWLEKKSKMIGEVKALLKEDREFSPEEKAQVDGLDAKIAEIDQRVAALESIEAQEAEATAAADNAARNKVNTARVSNPGNMFNGQSPAIHTKKYDYNIIRALDTFEREGRLNGFEGEVAARAAERHGKPQKGGFLVPMNQKEIRTYFGTTDGAGNRLTAFSNDYIDYLYNRTAVGTAGATIMSGLHGVVKVSRGTASASAAWVDENADSSESHLTTDFVTLTPTLLTAHADISNSLMQQDIFDSEGLVSKDLARAAGVKLDQTAVNGSGSGVEPTGIIQNGSVTSVALATNGGAPTWSMITQLEETVAVANADQGKLAYMSNAKVRGKGKRTVKDSNTAARYLVDDDGTLNSYPLYVSQNIPSNLTKATGSSLSALIFGNWEDVIIADWGAMELFPERISLALSGGLRVHLYLNADVKLKRTGSFAKCVDILTV